MSKIIISGTSSGIGRAIALHMLSLGHQVIGLSRRPLIFANEMNNYQHYLIDFADIANTECCLAEIKKQHSDVEIIIGNAGYGRFGTLEQFSTQQIWHLLQVNFLGQVLLVKTFLPQLKRQRKGKIILMGSEAALSGAKQGSIYCASKFALRGFCQSLRHECSSAGVAVTLINPGFVDTPFFASLNFAPGLQPENALQAEDVADTVAHLINLENHYVVEEINLQPLNKKIRTK